MSLIDILLAKFKTEIQKDFKSLQAYLLSILKDTSEKNSRLDMSLPCDSDICLIDCSLEFYAVFNSRQLEH